MVEDLGDFNSLLPVGDKQVSLFSKRLHKFLEQESIGVEIAVEDLGWHSLRKSATIKTSDTLREPL